MIPLYKAAGMSGAWFFALFVPVLNIVAQVIWSFRIVQARSKGPAISVMLLLPVLNVIAYLYLAFSEADVSEKETSKKIQMGGPQLMTLETA
jgi:bacteriorhodopsin